MFTGEARRDRQGTNLKVEVSILDDSVYMMEVVDIHCSFLIIYK